MFTRQGAIATVEIIKKHLILQAGTVTDVAVALVGSELSDVVDIIQMEVDKGFIFSEPTREEYDSIILEINDEIVVDEELYTETELDFIESLCDYN